VDTTNELSQLLTSRRSKVTPEQAGLPSYGRRQVPGLRREEVASLAGVSVEYYKRLERGNATDGVLELSYEVMEMAADSGLRLAVFTAAPGSRSQQALDLLASWAATPQPDSEADVAPRS
jgi:transcriptional regulator with XRE-family HTH domain